MEPSRDDLEEGSSLVDGWSGRRGDEESAEAAAEAEAETREAQAVETCVSGEPL